MRPKQLTFDEYRSTLVLIKETETPGARTPKRLLNHQEGCASKWPTPNLPYPPRLGNPRRLSKACKAFSMPLKTSLLLLHWLARLGVDVRDILLEIFGIA